MKTALLLEKLEGQLATLRQRCAPVSQFAPLSFSFWQGALMVCGGSLLCWLATRRG